jgi:hypothetical protein
MTLSGFTLFKVPRGWQLSTRTEGEVGWSVRLIKADEAECILSSLSGHQHLPDVRQHSALNTVSNDRTRPQRTSDDDLVAERRGMQLLRRDADKTKPAGIASGRIRL